MNWLTAPGRRLAWLATGSEPATSRICSRIFAARPDRLACTSSLRRVRMGETLHEIATRPAIRARLTAG
jgi:hypothetical protein